MIAAATTPTDGGRVRRLLIKFAVVSKSRIVARHNGESRTSAEDAVDDPSMEKGPARDLPSDEPIVTATSADTGRPSPWPAP
jgi:hypothetical protein